MWPPQYDSFAIQIMSLKRLTTKPGIMGYTDEMPVAISVAIVEDDTQTREILVDWISNSRGFRLAGEWENGRHALELLPKTLPDVVLMDINLPDISGVEGVKQLKRILPGTQFMMLTVYEDTDPYLQRAGGRRDRLFAEANFQGRIVVRGGGCASRRFADG